MIDLKGNYLLKVSFGGQDVAIDPQNIKEFTIVQDMYKYLPGVRMQLVDPQGVLTHIIPFDKGMSRVSVQIGEGVGAGVDTQNTFDFVIFKRRPEGQFGPSSVYDIRGLLDMEGIFAPIKCRSFMQSVKTTLTMIGLDELGCDEVEISPSLDYEDTMIQPNCSLIDWFGYEQERLMGKNGEGCFQIFVKVFKGKSVFVCRSLGDLVGQAVRYKFIVNDNPVEDYLPVVDYSIIDSYKLFGIFGAKRQSYSYFDYFTSTFKEEFVEAQDFYSLSEYFLIDNDDTVEGEVIRATGRSTELNLDFKGKVLANYHGRLNGLVKMWVLTWGLPNIVPGELVQVLFGQGQGAGELQSYQFSGYWMVERVVHTFTSTHRTRLLLTRSGVDTDKDTTLLVAVKAKKKSR